MTEKDLYERIIQCRSMTVIDYMIENAQNEGVMLAPHPMLTAIYKSNSLDERWMLAHEALGNVEEAEKIRTWLAKKNRI